MLKAGEYVHADILSLEGEFPTGGELLDIFAKVGLWKLSDKLRVPARLKSTKKINKSDSNSVAGIRKYGCVKLTKDDGENVFFNEYFNIGLTKSGLSFFISMCKYKDSGLFINNVGIDAPFNPPLRNIKNVIPKFATKKGFDFKKFMSSKINFEVNTDGLHGEVNLIVDGKVVTEVVNPKGLLIIGTNRFYALVFPVRVYVLVLHKMGVSNFIKLQLSDKIESLTSRAYSAMIFNAWSIAYNVEYDGDYLDELRRTPKNFSSHDEISKIVDDIVDDEDTWFSTNVVSYDFVESGVFL